MSDDSRNDHKDRGDNLGGEKDRENVLIKPPKASLLSNLRSSFFAGIVVVAPIGITVAIVYWFVTGPMAAVGFICPSGTAEWR